MHDTQLNSCDTESFSNLKSILSFNEKAFEDIFSDADISLFCEKQGESFNFTADMIPSTAKLVEQTYLDSLQNSYFEAIKNQTVQPGQFEAVNADNYIRFSQPVFFQNSTYAMIYYSKISSEYSSSLLVFEKVAERWDLIFSFPLTIS